MTIRAALVLAAPFGIIAGSMARTWNPAHTTILVWAMAVSICLPGAALAILALGKGLDWLQERTTGGGGAVPSYDVEYARSRARKMEADAGLAFARLAREVPMLQAPIEAEVIVDDPWAEA